MIDQRNGTFLHDLMKFARIASGIEPPLELINNPLVVLRFTVGGYGIVKRRECPGDGPTVRFRNVCSSSIVLNVRSDVVTSC
jgi:hypothetical protein